MSHPGEELKGFLADWLQRFECDDVSSLCGQTHRLLWDAATFRIINEARRLAGEQKRSAGSPLVHELIDRCFFSSQTLAIRRLLDPERSHGKRGVHSLNRLLQDIAEQAPLLTRENILYAHDAPYDYEPIRDAACDAAAQAAQSAGERVFTISGAGGLFRGEHWHLCVDELSGVPRNRRSRTDRVDHSVFDTIRQSLQRHCDALCRYAVKYVAHAATPESRQDFDARLSEVTWGRLWSAELAIASVVGWLGRKLLDGASRGLLATPQFDQFRDIDEPLVTTREIPALRQLWEQFEQEVHASSESSAADIARRLAATEGGPDVPTTNAHSFRDAPTSSQGGF